MGVSLAAQEGPEVVADLRPGDTPAANVRVLGLLRDRRFVRAMESGFPLYMEYQVSLKQPRGIWWDRTVAIDAWQFVVVFDPVRSIYVLEDAEGSEELGGEAALAGRLAAVYVVTMEPPEPGDYYFEATVEARTLSDEDVDEVFAWLEGDSAITKRPGFVTRTARKILVRIAPLPRVRLVSRTQEFVHR